MLRISSLIYNLKFTNLLPVVAIIGRPNVGKSTLFNMIVQERKAIVSHIAGTTRDRIHKRMESEEVDYMLVDTGGLDFDQTGVIEENIQLQAKLGVFEADLLVLVVNAKEELTLLDHQVVDFLRKNVDPKKVVLVANKCDRKLSIADLSDLLPFGFGEPLQVSAVNNRGTEEIKNIIETKLKERGFEKDIKDENPDTIKIALVGRPNVGKSSLVNAFLDEEKLIVSDIAGTTVDTTDSNIKYAGKDFTLIDTAGVRRKGKVQAGIEKYSIIRVFDAIDRADVVCMLIDGSEPVSKQDQHIIEIIQKAITGLILVVNKWDTQEKGEEARDHYFGHLRRKFSFIPWAPVLFVSAKTKRNIVKIFPLAEEIQAERKKRIPTGRFNDFIEKITMKHLPSGTKNVRPKIIYGAQVDTNPPHFRMNVNQIKYFHFSYFRYFENRLREQLGFAGTGIKLEWIERPKKHKKKG